MRGWVTSGIELKLNVFWLCKYTTRRQERAKGKKSFGSFNFQIQFLGKSITTKGRSVIGFWLAQSFVRFPQGIQFHLCQSKLK